MQVKAESYGHAVILNCRGELTQDGLEAFAQVVDKHLSDSVRDVVVNLAEVAFLDSAALEYLLGLQERLAEKLGQVRLARPDENVAKILEMTRLDGSFEIFQDLNLAVRAM